MICLIVRQILSWSGGKDSTASVILCHERGIPLDEIIFCEVMYDLKRGISGENPMHMEFIHNVAKPLFESWGYKVTILRSDRDYLYCFNHVMDKVRTNPENHGKRYGFPLVGRCVIQRDCKLRPMNRYLSGIPEGYVQYVGICADETQRLTALHNAPYKESLLENYGITEEMARRMCEKYGLLSPTYGLSRRGGCWMCPNSKICENAAMKQMQPHIWNEFVQLEDETGVAHERWNIFRETLKERDQKVDEFLLRF